MFLYYYKSKNHKKTYHFIFKFNYYHHFYFVKCFGKKLDIFI